MTLDDYQQAWQADAAQTRVTVNADLLLKEVQRSHGALRSAVFWRDFREVAVGLVLLPVWFLMGEMLELPWTWYLTVGALVWVIGFVLVDRWRHPQRPSQPGEPLLHYARESLAQVEHQIWLLRNIFWWYLLPFSISIMAFFLHVAWQSASAWWDFAIMATLWSVFLAVVYGSIYRLNQRAVRGRLEPRRQELVKLIASFEDGTTSADSCFADTISALADPALDCGWAQNWNRLIPSWREAAAITLATLGGALGGLFCGLRYRIPEMGPVFFQAVVGAVLAFEIALACVWLRFRKKQKHSESADRGQTPPVSGADLENSADRERPRLPRAPALLILALTVLVSILAVLALYRFADEARERVNAAGLDDVSAFNDDDLSDVDAWLRRIMDAVEYPSLSVAVVRDGEIVYRGAFGFEDVEARRPATPHTQYHVASVTKAFTASLAVILHERGVVDLDEPVVKYLPPGVSISTTPDVGATITLRQLASHTSGLPRGVPGRVQSVDGWYQLEPERLYDHLADVELESNPGTAEEYSNLGFGLLGHALERAAGKPFDRLIQDLICDPLQLARTAIPVDDTLRPATGYHRRSRLATTHSLRERLAASGGLVTSVEDLAKFLAAQMEPGVFSREMLDQLRTDTKLSDGSTSGNSLGWSVRWRESLGRVLIKNGGRSNCSAWIGFAPSHKVGVVVVTNCGGPAVDPIGEKLLEQSVPGRATRRPF